MVEWDLVVGQSEDLTGEGLESEVRPGTRSFVSSMVYGCLQWLLHTSEGYCFITSSVEGPSEPKRECSGTHIIVPWRGEPT